MTEFERRLLRALPLFEIEAEWVGLINGLVPDPSEVSERDVVLLMPPCGQYEPFVDAVHLFAVVFEHDGEGREAAEQRACSLYTRLRQHLEVLDRPVLYQSPSVDIRRLPECISFTRALAFLREHRVAQPETLDFLEQCADALRHTRLLRSVPIHPTPPGLSALPPAPRRTWMQEFFIGMPDDLAWAHSPDGNYAPFELVDKWKADIRPVTERLEEVLGQSVFYFADPDDDLDDDYCHRWLALHCWCSLLPDSTFVDYLLEATRTSGVKTLKAALIDPANYQFPWKVKPVFPGPEADLCRFTFPDKAPFKRVGIVLNGGGALNLAEEVALASVGCDLLFVAPRNLLSDAWQRNAARHAHSVCGLYGFDMPIELLAQVDKVYFIGNRPMDRRPFADLSMPREMQKMLWRAHQNGVELSYRDPGGELWNPETVLERTSVPAEIVAEDEARRISFSRIRVLRISAEYCSSGIWDAQGRNISLDQLALRFPFLRRLAAWQRDYDDTLVPMLPDGPEDDWWRAHEEEELGIARELKQLMGDAVDVQVWNEPAGWSSV